MPSLAQTHPALADQWVTTEDGKTPHDITPGSAYRATWRCPTCSHIWTAATYSRTRGTGCPECKRALISANRSRPRPGQSLAEKYPHLAAEWDTDRNQRNASEVSAHARVIGCWLCKECGHRWNAQVSNRTKIGGGHGCPRCAAGRHSQHMRVAVGGDSVAKAFPAVAEQWDFEAPENQGASPELVKSRSGIPRAWVCACGHRWVSTPASRALGYGCSRCRKRGGSAQEAAMLVGVQAVFNDAEPGVVPRTDGRPSRPWAVDALSAEARVIVEFDGSYWHGTRANPNALDRDLRKTADLLQQGWRVVRIREAPLRALTEHDLVVPADTTGVELSRLVDQHLRRLLAITVLL